MNLDDYYYQHLSTRTLVNKEDILSASKDIEHSFTGRVDVMGLNMFFAEASILLRNAVAQYEQGFFDSAFYSVRSALELARIIAYFSHQDEPIESDIYKKWVQGGKFPYDSKIKELLSKTSGIYGEVREALSDFFDSQDERLKTVQKYIHKQGYRSFYNQNPFRPDLREFRAQKIDELFLEFISSSTAEVAILRLCIDPFPVLLQDEAVMYKIHYQSVTEPYSEKTIGLIGEQNIANYQSTDYYKSHVSTFLSNEDLHEATHNLINSQYYDRTQWSFIKKQLHLVSDVDKVAVRTFNVSKSIFRIYFYNGWAWYFSNTKSRREQFGFDSQEMEEFLGKNDRLNVEHKGVFLSSFAYGEDRCWIEHNHKLTDKQSSQIVKILQKDTP